MNEAPQHERGRRPRARDGRLGSGELASSHVVPARCRAAERPRRAAECELLEAARNGDEDAFRHLVEINRTVLLAHCYRMLGSLEEAEDALQDTLLNAWRGLSGFDGRCALRRWLYRIATNACLDAIARRPKRVLSIDDWPRDGAAQAVVSAGAPWVEPCSDQLLDIEDGCATPQTRYEQREAVGLAFVMALQHLPPRQRAVLVLREALGFSAKEVAQSLGMTVTSVHSALQRARKAVDARVPEKSQQAAVRAPEESSREIVERFVDAFERADVEAMVALLSEDARLRDPLHPGRKVATIRAPRTVSFTRLRAPSELAA
jgi:RNA polymerase sigma-70 factor (ECF subfamily)